MEPLLTFLWRRFPAAAYCRPSGEGRRGLGEWMLRRLFVSLQAAGAASFTLEVRAANQPAIRLYQKLGFRCCGRRRGYYDDPPDDALILWRGGTQQQQEEE